jgi:hypothetical protein
MLPEDRLESEKTLTPNDDLVFFILPDARRLTVLLAGWTT